MSQHTGCSLAFDDFGLSDKEEEYKPEPTKIPEKKTLRKTTKKTAPAIAADTVMLPAEGVVLLVSRAGKNKIKPHALQTSFFAYPQDASDEDRKAVDDKVDAIASTFRANKYEVVKHTFDLPFKVDAICKVSKGYSTTVKALKAGDIPENDDEELKGKKRSRGDADKEAKKAKVA
jgi:hypothetical protein